MGLLLLSKLAFNVLINKYFLRPYSVFFLNLSFLPGRTDQFGPILPSSVLVQSPYCTTGALPAH
jgi:hypothetical protein